MYYTAEVFFLCYFDLFYIYCCFNHYQTTNITSEVDKTVSDAIVLCKGAVSQAGNFGAGLVEGKHVAPVISILLSTNIFGPPLGHTIKPVRSAMERPLLWKIAELFI